MTTTTAQSLSIHDLLVLNGRDVIMSDLITGIVAAHPTKVVYYLDVQAHKVMRLNNLRLFSSLAQH